MAVIRPSLCKTSSGTCVLPRAQLLTVTCNEAAAAGSVRFGRHLLAHKALGSWSGRPSLLCFCHSA